MSRCGLVIICAYGMAVSTALGCGDDVQRNIKRPKGTQEDHEEAKMELTIAKRDAIEPLMRTLDDASKAAQVRVDAAELLSRLYLREDDPRILQALLHGVSCAKIPES